MAHLVAICARSVCSVCWLCVDSVSTSCPGLLLRQEWSSACAIANTMPTLGGLWMLKRKKIGQQRHDQMIHIAPAWWIMWLPDVISVVNWRECWPCATLWALAVNYGRLWDRERPPRGGKSTRAVSVWVHRFLWYFWIGQLTGLKTTQRPLRAGEGAVRLRSEPLNPAYLLVSECVYISCTLSAHWVLL